MSDAEEAFNGRIAEALPDAPGYREAGGRRDTDAMVRAHVASELEALRGKLDELRGAATDEGEEDMVDDLDRIDGRMVRTVDALRGGGFEGSPFLDRDEATDEVISRVCAYDLALLEDVDLLVHDVNALKYDTIGNLTLREIEGTLAAIELKVSNRRDNLDSSGRE